MSVLLIKNDDDDDDDDLVIIVVLLQVLQSTLAAARIELSKFHRVHMNKSSVFVQPCSDSTRMLLRNLCGHVLRWIQRVT